MNPRPVNQAALDTCLTRSDPDTKARFAYLTGDSLVPEGSNGSAADAPRVYRLIHPTDEATMVKVDAGVYLSGQSNDPEWLPAFYIDVCPTSNAEYHRFVLATGHEPPRHWKDGELPEDLANHPVVFVTWKDAAAYAAWAGKQLPTSQQWEKAARGTRGAVYPWGDQPTPAKCNVRENGAGETTLGECYQSGVSPYGVYDMCGNVWEWCATESRPAVTS